MFLLNNKVQTGGYKTLLHFPECSLSFAKIVQTSGKKARFCFPECSLSYAKIVQTLFPTKQNPLFWPLPTLASLQRQRIRHPPDREKPTTFRLFPTAF